ncbi:MAG: LD-carboxypeptidase [Ectobacillus sp.]
MRKPPALKQGDAVMIVAPAGPVKQKNVLAMKAYLEQFGLTVWLGQHIFAQQGFLAGSDNERLSDLQEAFANPDVKAIFCARGGYGSARLLPALDFSPLQANPKIFWGYSDITSLHIAIQQQAQLVTFHGPMMQECGSDDVHPHTLSSFLQLFSPYPLVFPAKERDMYPAFSHLVTAPIVGGNLTVLTATLGTPYEIDTRGKILLLEDVGEEPYRLDRMLNQLRLAGKFQDCAGVVLSDFHDCKPHLKKASLSLADIIYDHIVPCQVPILGGFPIGHCHPNYGVPLGVQATMNGAQQLLVFEPGVM